MAATAQHARWAARAAIRASIAGAPVGRSATRATSGGAAARWHSRLRDPSPGARVVACGTSAPSLTQQRPTAGQRAASTDSAGASSSATTGRAKGRNTGGTIADLFTSLGADAPDMDPRFAALKESIRPPPEVLRDAWARLEAAIDARRAAVKADPEGVIPVVDFAEMAGGADGQVPEEIAARVRDVGVVVVRNTVAEGLALEWADRVKAYLEANPDYTGFPEDNPQVYEIYWSPSQVEARQHANVLELGRLMNGLWHTSTGAPSEAFDPCTPVSYVDRMRMRNPGDSSFSLGAHMDGGGIERWEDPSYRAVYRHILSGDWEAHDAFCLDLRDVATTDLYETSNACSVFRTFQGWLSLSDTGPGEGTLRVVPFLKEATAYMMLRPFLDDVPASEFPGAAPRTTQDISEKWHAPLVESVTSIPAVRPGDTVWWHCDTIHAVEKVHNGPRDSSVFYIPHCPLSHANARYLARQRAHFRAYKTPPDFPPNHSEVDFVGRGTAEGHMSAEGQMAMGVRPWDVPADSSPARAKLIQECNRILEAA